MKKSTWQPSQTHHRHYRPSYRLANVCGSGCPCKFKDVFIHLQLVRFASGDDPEIRYLNVRDRHEHETVIKDDKLCQAYGLDQVYEIVSYLKHWGDWLRQD